MPLKTSENLSPHSSFESCRNLSKENAFPQAGRPDLHHLQTTSRQPEEPLKKYQPSNPVQIIQPTFISALNVIHQWYRATSFWTTSAKIFTLGITNRFLPASARVDETAVFDLSPSDKAQADLLSLLTD